MLSLSNRLAKLCLSFEKKGTIACTIFTDIVIHRRHFRGTNLGRSREITCRVKQGIDHTRHKTKEHALNNSSLTTSTAPVFWDRHFICFYSVLIRYKLYNILVLLNFLSHHILIIPEIRIFQGAEKYSRTLTPEENHTCNRLMSWQLFNKSGLTTAPAAPVLDLRSTFDKPTNF
jgi:hypothetical protein